MHIFSVHTLGYVYPLNDLVALGFAYLNGLLLALSYTYLVGLMTQRLKNWPPLLALEVGSLRETQI